MTVYDIATLWMRKSFSKHGACLRYENEEEYILYELNRMDRREFLHAVSDAIEERLECLQSQINAIRENEP